MASIYELAQQINRQKRSTGGTTNQYFDNAMQVMQILDQKSKEKTARSVGNMETMMGDYQNIYDNNTLTKRMEAFDRRFGGRNLNKMSVDERDAYDNAKLMMTRQKEKNTNFDICGFFLHRSSILFILIIISLRSLGFQILNCFFILGLSFQKIFGLIKSIAESMLLSLSKRLFKSKSFSILLFRLLR